MFGETYLERLASTNQWWGVYDEGVLVAVASAAHATATGDERPIVTLTSAAVVKSARGKGLQRKLIKARVRWAERIDAKAVITYTYMNNPVSLTNLVRLGFHITRVTGDKINLRKDLP